MPASLYDAYLDKSGKMRYRMNNNFVKTESVPEHVKAVLTVDNVVDENGLVIVDQKNDNAKQPTQENDADANKADGNVTEDTNTNDTEVVEEDADGDGDEPDEEDEPENIKDTTAPTSSVADEDDDDEEEPEKPQEEVAPKPRRATRTTARVEVFKSKVPQSSPGMGFPRKNGKTVDIFDLKTPHTKVKLIGQYAVPLSEESYREKSETQIMNRLNELGFEVFDFNAAERDQALAGAADPGLLMDEDIVEDDIQLG